MSFLAMLLQESMNSTAVQQQIQQAMMVMIPIILFAIVIGLAIVIIPFWFICKKAGFSPWLSLLNIVPFGNLVLIYVLAFAEWKVVPAPKPAWPQPSYPQSPPQPPQA